jgi:hypothetical protein
VFADTDMDRLTGGAGLDWFFRDATDQIVAPDPGEVVRTVP